MEIEKLLREPHHLRAGMMEIEKLLRSLLDQPHLNKFRCYFREKSYGLKIKSPIKSWPVYLNNFHNSSTIIEKVLRT